MALVTDLSAQNVHAAVKVLHFPVLQTASPAIAHLEPGDALELGAQIDGFTTGQITGPHAHVDPVIKLGLTLVDVLPGRGGGGESRAGERRGRQKGDQELFHCSASSSLTPSFATTMSKKNTRDLKRF